MGSLTEEQVAQFHRSRKNPETELRDLAEWARRWHEARQRLATEGMGRFNRWSADSPVCA
jgi:hypothetical protein